MKQPLFLQNSKSGTDGSSFGQTAFGTAVTVTLVFASKVGVKVGFVGSDEIVAVDEIRAVVVPGFADSCKGVDDGVTCSFLKEPQAVAENRITSATKSIFLIRSRFSSIVEPSSGCTSCWAA